MDLTMGDRASEPESERGDAESLADLAEAWQTAGIVDVYAICMHQYVDISYAQKLAMPAAFQGQLFGVICKQKRE